MDMYQILAQLNSVGGNQTLTEGKKAKPDFLDVDKDGDKKEPFKKAVKDKETKVEEGREFNEEGESDSGPIEAHGVKGMNSTQWRKTFKNRAALDRWVEANDGDVEVYGTRKAEPGMKSRFNEADVEEGNEYTKARLDAIRSGKPTFRVSGKVHKVTGDTSDERQVDESDDEEVGSKRKTQHGTATRVAPNVTRHTRNYGDDDRGEDRGDEDDAPKAKGRPKGAGKKIGAKGPSGRSKLMREEGPGDDVQAAIELLMNNGYTVGKLGSAEEAPLDEKAVSKKQQRFMGMVHAAQKGEKAASPEVAKVAKSMGKKDAKDFASTKQKGLPEKKKEESVEETTVSGSVATAPAGENKSKGGMTFGKGVYEAKLAESFEAKLDSIMGGATVSIDDSGNMSVTVAGDSMGTIGGDGMGSLGSSDGDVVDSPLGMGDATAGLDAGAPEEAGSSLDDILRLSGMESKGYDEVCPSCGSAECTCDELDEAGLANAPDEQYAGADTMLHTLSGGLNGAKTTGQTTVPIINRDPARQTSIAETADKIAEQAESRLWQLYKGLSK